MANDEETSFLAWGDDSGHDSPMEVLKGGSADCGDSKLTKGWALVHMIKAFIGTAILAMPFTFKLAGLLGGTVLFALCTLAIYWAMLLLVESKKNVQAMIRELGEEPEDGDYISRHPRWRTAVLNRLRMSGSQVIYTDLGEVVFGSLGKLGVNMCLISLQLGIVVVYLIFIGKNMSNVVCKFSESEFCWGTSSLDLKRPVHSSKYYSAEPFHIVIVVATVIVVPFFLLGSLKKLRFASLAAVFSTVYAAVYVLWIQGTILYYEEEHHEVPAMNEEATIRTVLLFFGITVYAMEGIGLALPIEANLKNRNDYFQVTTYTVLVSLILNLAIGLLGYCTFADTTQDIVLLNFPPSNWTSVLQVVMCVSLLLTAPLQGLPALQIIERGVFGESSCDGENTGTFVPWKAAVLRSVIIVFLGVCAMYLPCFHVVIGLLGSFSCSCLGLTFPAVFVMATSRGNLHPVKKLALYGIVVLGLFVMIAGTGAILYDEIVKPKYEPYKVETHHAEHTAKHTHTVAHKVVHKVIKEAAKLF